MKLEHIIETSSGAGSVNGGQPSPNVSLLVPEKKPLDTHREESKPTPSTDLENVDSIASSVIPGSGDDYASPPPLKNAAVLQRILKPKTNTAGPKEEKLKLLLRRDSDFL